MNVVADEPGQVSPSPPVETAPVRGTPAEVWMLGPVPPPVTGMTVLTQEVLRAMQKAGPVRFSSWSPGMPRRTLRMRLVRNFRVLQSIAALVARGRVADGKLYLVANSRSGLSVTSMLVFVGRRLGYTVYLHHHVYSYIDAYDRRMAWIDRQLAGRGFHVVHAEKMIADFRKHYDAGTRFLIVHPSIVPIALGRARESSQRPFRLGLLSSLSKAKGIDVVIDTFRALRGAGRDVALTLAGPVPDAESKRLIEGVTAEFPQHARWLGPVYDDRKAAFFREIDAFVFPTMTESWGLVLNEALAAGVPVIASDRGCTSTVVGDEAGQVIDPRESFVEQAAQRIGLWMDDPAAYRRASQSAVAQAESLHHAGQQTLADFVRHMFSNELPAAG